DVVNKLHPALPEAVNNVLVVHDLVVDVDRLVRADAEQLVHHVDCHVDTGAEAAGVGEDDLHAVGGPESKAKIIAPRPRGLRRRASGPPGRRTRPARSRTAVERVRRRGHSPKRAATAFGSPRRKRLEGEYEAGAMKRGAD